MRTNRKKFTAQIVKFHTRREKLKVIKARIVGNQGTPSSVHPRRKLLRSTIFDPIPAGDPRHPYAMPDRTDNWVDIDDLCNDNVDDPAVKVTSPAFFK